MTSLQIPLCGKISRAPFSHILNFWKNGRVECCDHFHPTIKTLAIVLLSLFISSWAQAQTATPAHKDSLELAVQSYYDLSLKIYQANSTIADIDELFGLFTKDFVYIHPKYGGEYSRADLYEGYKSNQKNGAYNGSIVDLKVKNKISGLNAVATERVYFQKGSDGKLKEVDPGMTLFEFRDGKIAKIFEYW